MLRRIEESLTSPEVVLQQPGTSARWRRIPVCLPIAATALVEWMLLASEANLFVEVMIPRKPVPRRSEHHKPGKSSASYWQEPLLGGAVLVLLAAAFPLARIWLLSGAGIESSLILWGSRTGSRVFSSIPLWTVLATLNLIYAICSTSWLLHGIFATLCWISVGLTSLFQFPTAAHYARRALRKALGKHPHFIKDKIALFNLPALEIDTEVDGLMVMRGVTISLSSLTLVVHGIELGLKLADDIELAIYVDEVTVRLFRRIEVGDVYANVKGGQFEMTFSGLDDPADDAASVESVFLDDTPLLRAATLGSEGFQDRPKLRETLTGVSYIRDSSARAGFDSVQSFSPDDEIADRQYHDRLTDIRTSSAVYQSRQQVRHKAKSGSGFTVDDEQDMRAAVSAELHGLPSVPHPPSRSVRVTTLQRLSPPYMRRFMHRLPFLLRLLLAPLSYFHPINISSVNAAGSGQWVSQLLQQQVFKEYAETNLQLRKLHRRISHWLADANFCLQLADIHGLGQVPLSTSFDIVAYLKFNDVMAYRTEPQSSTIRQVVRLGGADATFTIPSFLLPHHEHIVPPKRTAEDEEELEVEIEESTSLPKAVQIERELKRTKKDETEITMSVHASLPASCDQSLLNFIAALVKATKIIELEKEVDEVDTASPSSDEPATPTSPTFDNIDSISIASNDSTSTDFRTRSPSKPALPLNSVKDIASFKLLAKNIRQNLKDGTTSNSIKEFARDLHQQTKDGMKKAMVGGLVNDRWIAKLVGKTAAMLQKAQGDVGYSGSIPIALGPYRSESTGEWGTKILP